MIRQEILSPIHPYGAKAKIVYLETDWQELLRRNRERDAVVPENKILKMLDNLVPPGLHETEEAVWINV